MSRSSSQPDRRGFTLLEVILVAVIIAILSAMVVPRFAGLQQREFDLFVEQAADLLMVYAQRDQLSQQPVGLHHDVNRNILTLQVLDIDPDNPQNPPFWRYDTHSKAVKLPPFLEPEAIRVNENSRSVDITQWPLASRPNETRPEIELIIEGPDDTVTLHLASHALAPRRRVVGDRTEYRAAIDLDAEGRDREEW